jgi:hypothetical protein
MWYIDGTGADLSFSIDSNGRWRIWGHGKHYCEPSTGDLSFLTQISAVKEMSWDMYSSGTEAAGVDIARPGVWKRFQENPSQSLASISYLSGSPGSLWAQIMLTENMGIIFYDLCKTIMGRSEIRYRLMLEFFGLLTEPSSQAPDLLSVTEFMNPDVLDNKSYICENFKFILPDRELTVSRLLGIRDD